MTGHSVDDDADFLPGLTGCGCRKGFPGFEGPTRGRTRSRRRSQCWRGGAGGWRGHDGGGSRDEDAVHGAATLPPHGCQGRHHLPGLLTHA
jgi:hypothetical protein